MTDKLLRVLGSPVEEASVEQLKRCLKDEEAIYGVLNADHHLGYSMPIGGVIAYKDTISPSGVGYDIGCGNKAVMTNLVASDMESDMERIMDEIFNKLEFGMGRTNPDPEIMEHPIFHSNVWDMRDISKLKQLAMSQLGTIGAGNHYVDIFRDEQDRVWIGVHFGSRGFGHKICTGFMNRAKGKKFSDKPGHEDMNAPATVFGLSTNIGWDYYQAMELAGDYAYAGRNYVCNRVLDILQAKPLHEVHNHHNYAWIEEHFGEELIVVRKGATPAWPGQECCIGGSMGDDAVIVEGVEHPLSNLTLHSTVHGAGRVMSRTQAKGKLRRNEKGKKVRTGGNITRGEMDGWLDAENVVLRGADVDEAPQAYKRLPAVLEAQGDTIKIKHTLTPMGVAMAGPFIRDEYKD